MQTCANYRMGGGCKPTGEVSPAALTAIRRAELAKKIADQNKKRAEREAWLQTPEGQAWQEDRRKEAAEAEERQRLAQEEQARKDRWAERYNNLHCSLPKPGEVFTGDAPTRQYTIRLQTDKRTGGLAAYVLLEVRGTYPQQPYRALNQIGRKGLKVFLNKKSRDQIAAKHPESFEVLSVSPDATDYVECTDPIRIIGVATSGKAVHGELVM